MSGVFRTMGTAVIGMLATVILLSLLNRWQFKRIKLTDSEFKAWKSALEDSPELARYQQWLFEHRDQWPVRAEVEVAKQQATAQRQARAEAAQRKELETLVKQQLKQVKPTTHANAGNPG